MRRYPYIDVARGIGMVLVVAGHAMGISMYLTCFYAVILYFPGYVYQRGKSYKQNMKRKTERLLVPYFLEVLCCWEYIKYLAAQQRNVVFRYRGIVFKVLLL